MEYKGYTIKLVGKTYWCYDADLNFFCKSNKLSVIKDKIDAIT